MQSQTNQPAHHGSIDADKLQIEANLCFQVLSNFLRIPCFYPLLYEADCLFPIKATRKFKMHP